jgi:dephospho-CoA kinase
MIRVGLTGGIGSGKTTIANFFSILGIPIYFSDERAKLLMVNNLGIKEGLIELLGANCYLLSGEINKEFISKRIFSDRQLLDGINKIVHPVVKSDFEEFCMQNSNKKYIIKESAILVETGLFKTLDKLILITANQELRISRLQERDKQKAEEISTKISKQLSDSEKKGFADYIIENNNQEFLIPQLIKIHTQLSSIN